MIIFIKFLRLPKGLFLKSAFGQGFGSEAPDVLCFFTRKIVYLLALFDERARQRACFYCSHIHFIFLLQKSTKDLKSLWCFLFSFNLLVLY